MKAKVVLLETIIVSDVFVYGILNTIVYLILQAKGTLSIDYLLYVINRGIEYGISTSIDIAVTTITNNITAILMLIAIMLVGIVVLLVIRKEILRATGLAFAVFTGILLAGTYQVSANAMSINAGTYTADNGILPLCIMGAFGLIGVYATVVSRINNMPSAKAEAARKASIHVPDNKPITLKNPTKEYYDDLAGLILNGKMVDAGMTNELSRKYGIPITDIAYDAWTLTGKWEGQENRSRNMAVVVQYDSIKNK